MQAALHKKPKSKGNPQENAGFLTRVFFWWVLPYLRVFRNPELDFDDLMEPRPADHPALTLGELQTESDNGHGLFYALVRANKKILTRAALFALLVLIASGSIPLLFQWFLRLLVADAPLSEILVPLLVLAVCSILHSVSVHHMFFQVLLAAQRVRVTLPPLIFRKVAKLSHQALLDFPSGRIMNLAATDSNRISWFFNMCFSFVLHPFQVLITMAVLYHLLGVAGLIGSSALLVCIAVGLLSNRKQAALKKSALKIADVRVALITEALAAIKLIKLYGWETPRSLQIDELRKSEARILRKAALLEGFNTLLFGAAPVIFLLVTLSVMLANGRTPRIDELLPAISALATLRFALAALPSSLQSFLDARVSAARMQELLSAPEDMSSQLPRPALPFALQAHGLTSTWPNGQIALRKADLELKNSEIVAILGTVGAGKTALLLTLLGALQTTRGTLAITGNRQYVPQVPWILSDTVRENILMGQPFDAQWYKQILRATALDEDALTWPQGDLTTIGERGVNLSGGQRSRVALARAAYARPDLLLLDDPLSALDPRVADTIFRELLRNELQGCAIVLVTHRPEFAQRCDYSFSLTDGILSACAPHLLSHNLSELHSTPETTPDTNAEALANLNSQSAGIIVAEDRRVGPVQASTINTYLGRYTANGWGLLLLAILVFREFAGQGLDLWIALVGRGMAFASEHAITGVIVLGFTSVLLMFSRLSLMLLHGITLSSRYHKELVRGVLAAPLSFFSANPVGRIANRFSRDVSTLDDLVPRMLHDFVGSSISALLIVCVIVAISPSIIVVLIPVIALYFWAQKIYRPASRECQRLESVSRSPILALIAETCAGVPTLRGSTGFAALDQRMLAAAAVHGKAFFNMVSCNRWLGLMVESLSVLVIVSAFTVAVRAQQHSDIALVGLSLTLVLNLNSILNWLIRSLSMLEAGLTSAERIAHYTSIPPEENSSAAVFSETELAGWPSKGALSFKSASFAYRSDLPATLRDVTVEIRAGERIGIIGRTGAGKSTLLLGLFRAIEQRAGSIEIDGIALNKIPRSIIRHRLGFIPQEPVILSGTLRENIDPFLEYSDQQLLQVLGRSQLSQFMQNLPNGLQFKIADGGANLSHGQRQLICLARVLLKQPKIVVFDEATSSVDPLTDALIQKTIRTEFNSATVITIAHRIETILDYDRVIVVERGEVVGIGTPAKML